MEDADDIATLADFRRTDAGERVPHAVVKRMVAGEHPVTAWRGWRGFSAAELARRAGISRQMAVSPAGDVWVMNNWQITDSCFLNTNKDEALSTRCGGNGVTIFFGMAKPVRAPQIGPARAP